MSSNWYSRSLFFRNKDYNDLVAETDKLKDAKTTLEMNIKSQTEELNKLKEQLKNDQTAHADKKKQMEKEIEERQKKLDELKRQLDNLMNIQIYITQQMGIGGNISYWSNQQNSIPDNTALTRFNEQLKQVYATLAELNTVQNNALSKQNEVKNIVTSESKRLENKKSQIDQAIVNQKHIIYANDNNRKVQAGYLNIVVTLVITLGIIWVIRVLNRNFGTFIPEFIITIALILTISIGLIYIFNYYVAIRSRDNYNFDELKLDPPAPLATPTPDPYTKSLNNNLLGVGTCVGEKCCSEDTVWDNEKGICTILDETSGPTSTLSPDLEEFTVKNTIPYSEAYGTYLLY
jgi:membrane-associated HD superfamily phosphohydrolase